MAIDPTPASSGALKWLLITLLGGTLALYFAWPRLFPPPTVDCEPLRKLTQHAEELGTQKTPNWPEVKSAWGAVKEELDHVGDGCADTGLAGRIEKNLALVKERLGADTSKTLDMKEEREQRKEEPKEDPYRKLSNDELMKYYKEGKKIRSAATFRVGGKGSATNWGIREDRFFQHVYEVVAETEIEKNDGNSVRILFSFPQVTKTVIFSEEQLEFDPPPAPLFEAAWPLLEKAWAPLVVVRKTMQLASLLDPKGRTTLTVLGPVVKSLGKAKDAKLDVFEAPEAISGCSFRVVYERDFGIKNIEIVGDAKVSRGTLYKLGDSITLFADCFVFPDERKKEGDEWTLDAQNLPGAIPLSLDVRLKGSMDVKLKELKGTKATLEVKPGGKVEFVGRDPKMAAKGNLETKRGHIEFALGDELMTKRARIDFDVSGDLASQDHFIFPMKISKALSVQSTYEAFLVNPGIAAKAPDAGKK